MKEIRAFNQNTKTWWQVHEFLHIEDLPWAPTRTRVWFALEVVAL